MLPNFTIIIEVLSFLILLWILNKILYKPALRFLDKRKEAIAGSLKESEKRRKESEDLLNQAKKELANAEEKAIKILEKSHLKSDEERRKILESAKKESQTLIENSRKELQREIKQAKEELLGQISVYSVDIAKKVLRREIKKEDHKRVIEDAIRELSGD